MKEIKEIAVKFFYWWWNQKGSNTEQGFDSWAETDEGKSLLAQHHQPSSINNARAIGLLQGVVKGIETMGSDVSMEGIVKSLEEAVGLIGSPSPSPAQEAVDDKFEFIEWIRKHPLVHVYWDNREKPYDYNRHVKTLPELYEFFLQDKKAGLWPLK